jgi:MATE family multidrug resistance protein
MNRALIREVWDLVVPVIVQGMVVTLVFFTDRLLIGRYDDVALASMQISGPLMWSIFSVSAATSAGTMAVIGRAVGSGDARRARRALASVFVLTLIIGVVATTVCVNLRFWFAEHLAGGGDTAQAQALALIYMQVVFFALPLSLIQVTGVTALQADGDTRTPMWISGLQGLLNLCVSITLMWGYGPFPELGIKGAAIGTFVSFATGAILVLVILFQRRGTVTLRSPERASLEALKPIIRLSIPAFGEKMVFHTAFVIFAAYVGHLGTLEMSANQALIAIESMGFIVAHGFSVVASALVAQKMGSQKINEAAAVGWISAGLGTLVLGSIGLLFWFAPAQLIRCFTDNPEIVALGVPCLRIAAVVQPLMAICEAMAGALRGAGDTKTPLVAAFIGPCVIRLFFCWFLAFELNLGLIGIWIGTSLDWVVRVVFLSVVFHRGRWKRIVI